MYYSLTLQDFSVKQSFYYSSVYNLEVKPYGNTCVVFWSVSATISTQALIGTILNKNMYACVYVYKCTYIKLCIYLDT